MSPVEALTCPKCGGNVSESDENCPACGVSIRVLPKFGAIHFGMARHGKILDKAKKALKLDLEDGGLDERSQKLLEVHINNMGMHLEVVAAYGIDAPVARYNMLNHEITQVEGIVGAL